MADRTHPIIGDHVRACETAVQNYLTAAPGIDWIIARWQRPRDLDQRFSSPPYALIRVYPSTGEFDGPLTDTQIDIVLRIQILGVGVSEDQAIDVTDICRNGMKRSLVSPLIPNRRVMDLRLMVAHGGARRDDDLQTPFFYSTDLYELQTTPE